MIGENTGVASARRLPADLVFTGLDFNLEITVSAVTEQISQPLNLVNRWRGRTFRRNAAQMNQVGIFSDFKHEIYEVTTSIRVHMTRRSVLGDVVNEEEKICRVYSPFLVDADRLRGRCLGTLSGE